MSGAPGGGPGTVSSGKAQDDETHGRDARATMMAGNYQLVQLASGENTLFSTAYGEKMHPGLGPSAEAELLYVRQLQIGERLRAERGEFVIWDVGLGGAANAIAALRATSHISGQLRLVSFDNTDEPLLFALSHASALGYLAGYEVPVSELLQNGVACFTNGAASVTWQFIRGEFPEFMKTGFADAKVAPPGPHAIFYDAFSPAKNPAMWTLPVFEDLFRRLGPARSCALTTYSRSTMIRATLLLAGFFVGVGHATGMKEETTIAANTLDLIAEPLGSRWLERAGRSDSAEPLRIGAYARFALSPTTRAALSRHAQFKNKQIVS